uniref:Uncharacterized protein n=1 Tax=Solanum lycopersicum TaxID=4081 RepID=A0A3Q7HNA2_SOLLC
MEDELADVEDLFVIISTNPQARVCCTVVAIRPVLFPFNIKIIDEDCALNIFAEVKKINMWHLFSTLKHSKLKAYRKRFNE